MLEEDLGVTLFRRTRRGVEITEEGERLRSATAAPLRQLELAVQYVGSPLARLERGVRLGMPESTVGLLAAPLIGSLTTVFPRVSFSVAVGSTDVLVEAMLKGAVDVALINPVPDDRVFYRRLFSEELVVMGGPQADLDPNREVAFAEFVEMPLVIPRSPTGIGHALENAALRTKVTIQYHTATDSLQVTKSLIEAGLAYAALPLSACVCEVEDGRIRYAPLTKPALAQHMGVAATAQSIGASPRVHGQGGRHTARGDLPLGHVRTLACEAAHHRAMGPERRLTPLRPTFRGRWSLQSNDRMSYRRLRRRMPSSGPAQKGLHDDQYPLRLGNCCGR